MLPTFTVVEVKCAIFIPVALTSDSENMFHRNASVGRIPWTGDKPVARPLPTHRTTQTE
jgi:hypothetical protein